jgi:hypothetical protein
LPSISAKVVQRVSSRSTSRSLRAPQAQQSLGLGAEGIGDDIEVHAVLDGLRLRHLLEGDTWPAGVAVTGEQDRVLGSGVFGNLPPQDIGPEPGQDSGIGAVKGDCEQRIAYGWHLLLGVGIGYPGSRGQMAVRPPSAAMTAPVM